MLPIAAAAAGSVVATTAATIGVGVIDTIINWTKSGSKPGSLADVARPARVEFISLIDEALVGQPYMQDICKLALSNAAGYYMQAVNLITGVSDINTLAVFDSLNPHRTIGGGTVLGEAVRREGYKGIAAAAGMAGAMTTRGFEMFRDGLPSCEEFGNLYPANVIAVASNEAYRVSVEADKANGKDDKKDTDDKGVQSFGASIADGAKIYEAENLAIGKLLNVELKDGESRAKLPVLLRLIPTPVPSGVLAHIFSAGGRDSWAQRFFMVQTGQLRFWSDFVMGQDMIDAHFKTLMEDKSGAYKAIMDRRRNNTEKAMTTGRVSLADASNIAIVSDATLKLAGSKLYGKIEQKSVRDAIFDNSYLLLLLVIEERYSRVTVYHRGLDLSTTHRFDEVKAAEKNKGSDIQELFKVFNKAMQTNI